MLYTPIYDPTKTFEENFKKGPFGDYIDGNIFENPGEPKYEFFDHLVFLPFGIANGPLINSRYVKAALDKGYDIVEYKDVRTRKLTCNPLPNLLALKPNEIYSIEEGEKGMIVSQNFQDPISIVNSFGIPSMSPDFWQDDLRKAYSYAGKGQIVIAGIQATLPETGGFDAYLQDFIQDTRLVKETGPKVVEVNLSCPNEGAAHLLCFDIERSQQVAYAVKNELGNIPLIVKIAYFPQKDQFKKFVEAVGPIADAIAAINTITTRATTEDGKNAFPDNRTVGGAGGWAVQWAGLEMVRELKLHREQLNLRYKIIGIGGVNRPNDYTKYINEGADIVMTASGAIWNPYLAQEIKQSLLK